MTEQPETITTANRPFMLSLLCITLMVYAATLVVIFFLLLIFNNWVTQVVSDYFSRQSINRNEILIISSIGFVLHVGLFLSGILLWKLKKKGFYLMVVCFAILALLPFIFGFGSWLSIIIYGLMVVLVSLFYKKYS